MTNQGPPSIAVASSICPSASAMRMALEETGRFVDIDMRLHVDLDAEPGRLADQEARRADPAFAEMKVVADRDAADAEPFDQIMVNEILRRGAGAGLVEGHHHGAGKAGCRQKPELGGLVGEAELRANSG